MSNNQFDIWCVKQCVSIVVYWYVVCSMLCWVVCLYDICEVCSVLFCYVVCWYVDFVMGVWSVLMCGMCFVGIYIVVCWYVRCGVLVCSTCIFRCGMWWVVLICLFTFNCCNIKISEFHIHILSMNVFSFLLWVFLGRHYWLVGLTGHLSNCQLAQLPVSQTDHWSRRVSV